MTIRVLAVSCLGVVLCAHSIVAQTPFKYREYALGSSVASVLQISHMRADAVRTLHERPARIQELEWRSPYVPSGTQLADPVREILFSFYDDQLYQLVVTYDRDRIQGLTNDDLIEAISATYGVPILRGARIGRQDLPADPRAETTGVARWEDPTSVLTLTRDTYSPHYQLVLVSTSLDPRARAAITEARRLEALEAPQRERDQRTKEAADARAAGVKARVVNKAAFKP